MKRYSPRPKGQESLVSWAQYLGMVLAFIGCWQLLSKLPIFLQQLM